MERERVCPQPKATDMFRFVSSPERRKLQENLECFQQNFFFYYSTALPFWRMFVLCSSANPCMRSVSFEAFSQALDAVLNKCSGHFLSDMNIIMAQCEPCVLLQALKNLETQFVSVMFLLHVGPLWSYYSKPQSTLIQLFKRPTITCLWGKSCSSRVRPVES